MAYNFRPETRSLFKTLKQHNFTLFSVNNGGETILFDDVSITEFLEETVAADEAFLRVVYDGKKYSLYLVFGNSPGELVCDYTDFDPLSDAVDEHAEKWENKKQPIE